MVRSLLVPLTLLLALAGAAPSAAGSADLAPREPLTGGVLRGLLEAALPAQPAGRRLELTIAEPRLPLANPSDRPVRLTIEELSLDEARQRFTAQLVVRVEGSVTGVLPLAGEARPQVEVPALVQPVRDGQTIEPALLGAVWVPERSLRPDVLLAAEEIVGREAERRLPPGRPLRQADLRSPRLVRKGEVVTLLFRRGPIEISAQGRALEDGAEGARVRATNLDSERPVVGLVIGRRRLLVGAGEASR